MTASAHVDTFARDNLPPRAAWPELVFELPELQYPARMNCATELVDRAIDRGWGERTAILTPDGARWTYAELHAHSSRIARVLVEDMGLVPGNRVLLRGPNTPAMAACWFAVIKAGGIAVATMALLASLGKWRSTRFPSPTHALRTLGLAAAAALVLQISLGGWTSSNYAALACPDFPTCQTQWWPAIADFKEAFVLWRGIGIDYEGGVLDHPARVAVHFTHRLGAVLAAVLIALLGIGLARESATRADGAALLAVLALQLCLGVSIVWFGVPLGVAVLHNGVAALLLLAVINANQRIRQR